MKRLETFVLTSWIVVTLFIMFSPNVFAGDRYEFKLIPVSFEITWFNPFDHVIHKIGKTRFIEDEDELSDYEYYEIRNNITGDGYMLYYGEGTYITVCYDFAYKWLKYKPGVTYSGVSPTSITRKLCSSDKSWEGYVYDYDSKKYTGSMENYRAEFYTLRKYKKNGNTYSLVLIYIHRRDGRQYVVLDPEHYTHLCKLLHKIHLN